MHRVDLGQHERDFPLIPNCRPMGGREIFDDENWSNGVVFPPHQLRDEIATDQRVIANLTTKHLAGQRRRSDLDEEIAVGSLTQQPQGWGVAAFDASPSFDLGAQEPFDAGL